MGLCAATCYLRLKDSPKEVHKDMQAARASYGMERKWDAELSRGSRGEW